MFKEYDVVKVKTLREQQRPYTGTEAVRREPRSGDTGSIVYILGSDGNEMKYVVESITKEGLTLWLADFWESELEPTTGC
jgi:hypothetical protein